MGKKRLRANPRSAGSKSKNEDQFNNLPDDILFCILSFFNLKAAVGTSILSRRWRYLWTHAPCLDFRDSLETEQHRYVEWVDEVVKAHQAPIIDEFSVCFDLDSTYASNIDKWILFSTKKRVKSLELNFESSSLFLREEPYSFPLISSIQTNHGYGFTSLKSLSLKRVNVTGEVLEYFLSICPFLERLTVERSDHLLSLKLHTPSLPLNYLNIYCCSSMQTLEVYAPNLVTFRCYGVPTLTLALHYAPLLVHFDLGAGFLDHIIYNFSHLSTYLPQLQTLKLFFHLFKEDMLLSHFPVTLSNLKHLEVRITAADNTTLLGLMSLIKASPCLHTFVLKLLWAEPDFKRKMYKGPKCAHKSLKEVEFVGFVGRTNDVELTMCILANAPSLEKLIIDPRYSPPSGPRFDSEFMDKKRAAASKKLKPKLPKGVQLVIL